ncbi:MAG: ornithine aminomutase subunit alpha [Acholeplasmataceae bacterium]|jgi:D-ornithine 4,5-aminomutase subunit alpha|nr:ornithine aminomutase subunit alpha [Acholeplasmataceae bacterium]
MKARNDDFNDRRKHLKQMSDEQLKAYFEKLTDQMIDPLLELAYTHTTPAIERSVLMRMGFSGLEAKALTDKMMDYHLLEHGSGHVVFQYAQMNHLSIREAGLKLLDTNEMIKIVEVFIHENN